MGYFVISERVSNVTENGSMTAHPRGVVRAALVLCWREIIRFFRQRNRVIGAVGTPLVFWLLFGAGLDQSFRLSLAGGDEQGFREYFFPGTVVLILMFTAIFTSISIIEDRREGFLQSVLVSPLPRGAMVIGKVLGGTLIALTQGLVFCLLALLLPQTSFTGTSLVFLVLLMFVVSVALNAMGYVLAWRMDSTQGFHAIMNLLLMPMWLLSGSFFPIPALGSASWGVLHWIMKLNPLTYGVTGVRHLMFDLSSLPSSDQSFWSPRLTTCWIVSALFAAVALVLACRVSESRTTGGAA